MFCGIAYRKELDNIIYQNKKKISFIEITANSFIPLNRNGNLKRLETLAENFKIFVHGTTLSIASPTIDISYLKEIKEICSIVSSPYYSDHLSISSFSDINLSHFSPLLYNEKILNRLISNIHQVQNFIERPLLLENISYHFFLNDSPFIEADFFNKLCEKTNCGILLDLANLHANSINHKFDPYEYIDTINKKNIFQIHIAGGEYDKKGYLYDSHGNLVEKQTWELLFYLVKEGCLVPIILEYDQKFPETKYLLMELELMQKVSLQKNNIITG